jgi:activating signal cointegrator complex subunit 2
MPPRIVRQQTSLFGQFELWVQLSVTSPMHCPWGVHDSVAPPGPPPSVTQHCWVVGSHDCAPHDICERPPLLLPLPPPLPLPLTPLLLPTPLLPPPLPEPLPPLLPPPSAVGPPV